MSFNGRLKAQGRSLKLRELPADGEKQPMTHCTPRANEGGQSTLSSGIG